MNPKSVSRLAVLMAALLISPATPSQVTRPQKQDDQLRLSTDLVSLKVTVSDSFGRVVTGLGPGPFVADI